MKPEDVVIVTALEDVVIVTALEDVLIAVLSWG